MKHYLIAKVFEENEKEIFNETIEIALGGRSAKEVNTTLQKFLDDNVFKDINVELKVVKANKEI